MKKREAIVIYDEEIASTDMARLFDFNGEEVWIPESLILWEDEDMGEILLPTWFIDKEGLEGYMK